MAHTKSNPPANKGGVVGGTKGTNSKVPLASGSNRDEANDGPRVPDKKAGKAVVRGDTSITRSKGNVTTKDKGKNIIEGSVVGEGSRIANKGKRKNKVQGKGVTDTSDFVENSLRVTRGSVKGKAKLNEGVAQLNEVRTKFRNDPALLAFKRSLLGGEILKRKLSETSGKDVAGSSVVPSVRVVSPVAPTKRTRIDKRKVAVGNYTKLEVKKYDDYPSFQ